MAYRNRSICTLLIITMCALEWVYTSTTDGNEPFSDWLNKTNVQKGPFARTSCQWDPGDKSLMCKGLHLSSVPSNFPHSAMTMNLANNAISILLNTSFEYYPNLVTLDLKNNQLKTIKSAAFQPLKHLETLDLSKNYNFVIPSRVPFQPLEALVQLVLRQCNLEDFPNDLMDGFPNLRHLILDENRLRSLNVSRCKTAQLNEVLLSQNQFRDLSPDTFRFVCTTETLALLNNPIRYISEDAIAELPVDKLVLGVRLALSASMLSNLTRGVARSNITLLGFDETELRDGIPVDVFKPFYDHSLDVLIIESSGDLPIYKNVFSGLSCLTLVLTGNFINEIEPEYFLGMPRLRKLFLMDNQIIHLNPHKTTWESNMDYLDLSENKIYEIHGYQLRGLNHLKLLNVSRNRDLIELEFISYDKFESLEILDLTGTAISDLGLSSGILKLYFADVILLSTYYPFIPGITFNNTIKIEVIDVSHTELNEGHLWDSYSRRSLFQGLINLRQLHLSNNPLGNLPERVFEDNSLLAKLMMNNCKLSSLTGAIFQGLQTLVYLNLDGNMLFLISTYALKYLPMLETLSINDNTIMFVEEGAMKNTPLLKNFSMSNNRLVAFNRSTWNTLLNYDLDYLDISGNPFACQCKYDWLHDLAESAEFLLQQNKTLCSDVSLGKLRGKPLLRFDPSKYCRPNIVLVSILPFAALTLIIGLVLAFHNRWLIRYKLFLVKLAVIGYMEVQDAREHTEFIFDLNIMYTEDDEKWAREHLRPTLEERLPDFDRYSFGDEDLTLGMHYLEAVHCAVENSFKTILLISRKAVRDNWFLMKLRTAMDHVHDELTENTVVIFLEDIPEDEIPYLLRLYLSDRRPYMRWPEDVRGQQYFWNELTKTVTVNLKYNPLIPPE